MNSLSKSLLLYILLIFLLQQRRSYFLFFEAIRQNWMLTAIVRIQPYAYSEAPGIKHLFFYFEGSREAVSYFLLESSVWQAVQKEIME